MVIPQVSSQMEDTESSILLSDSALRRGIPGDARCARARLISRNCRRLLFLARPSRTELGFMAGAIRVALFL